METNYIELKAIDNSVFDSFESFLHESLQHFHGLDQLDEDMIIYMPSYFNKMLSYYISGSLFNKKPMGYMDRFKGIKVVDGYQNKIIIAIKYGMLYNIEPLEMPIP